IPFDMTPPQISEGKEYLNLPITPVYANSKMLLSMTGTASQSTGAAAGIAVALFRNGVSNTLVSCQPVTEASTRSEPFAMQIDDLPATVSTVIYSVRFGSSVGTTTVVLGGRGDSGGMFGGTM